ncbi:MAG: flagellar motor switch protein FliG, partial [Verrucomicrobiales bacterium]|nr:flagellar motor switch protein FliG [Verrucomicrobiales bacterium]
TAVLGGLEFTRHALEKSIGSFRASDILNRVAPTRAPVAALGPVAELHPRELVNLIKNEPPQTIALVLGQLSPDKSSKVLALLRPELRGQVVERLATMSPTPVEVVERVLQVLNERLRGKRIRALNRTGGVKTAAEVLNALDRNLSKELLVALEERNPELGQAIRKKMFTFEDLTLLDQQALQKVLREVEMRDLALALKTSSEKLKALLLSCISKRAAETVNEEMSFMSSVKLKEVEAAQARIIEVVRRLESEGEIEIGGQQPAPTSE